MWIELLDIFRADGFNDIGTLSAYIRLKCFPYYHNHVFLVIILYKFHNVCSHKVYIGSKYNWINLVGDTDKPDIYYWRSYNKKYLLKI